MAEAERSSARSDLMHSGRSACRYSLLCSSKSLRCVSKKACQAQKPTKRPLPLDLVTADCCTHYSDPDMSRNQTHRLKLTAVCKSTELYRSVPQNTVVGNKLGMMTANNLQRHSLQWVEYYSSPPCTVTSTYRYRRAVQQLDLCCMYHVARSQLPDTDLVRRGTLHLSLIHI